MLNKMRMNIMRLNMMMTTMMSAKRRDEETYENEREGGKVKLTTKMMTMNR